MTYVSALREAERTCGSGLKSANSFGGQQRTLAHYLDCHKLSVLTRGPTSEE